MDNPQFIRGRYTIGDAADTAALQRHFDAIQIRCMNAAWDSGEYLDLVIQPPQGRSERYTIGSIVEQQNVGEWSPGALHALQAGSLLYFECAHTQPIAWPCPQGMALHTMRYDCAKYAVQFAYQDDGGQKTADLVQSAHRYRARQPDAACPTLTPIDFYLLLGLPGPASYKRLLPIAKGLVEVSGEEIFYDVLDERSEYPVLWSLLGDFSLDAQNWQAYADCLKKLAKVLQEDPDIQPEYLNTACICDDIRVLHARCHTFDAETGTLVEYRYTL